MDVLDVVTKFDFVSTMPSHIMDTENRYLLEKSILDAK